MNSHAIPAVKNMDLFCNKVASLVNRLSPRHIWGVYGFVFTLIFFWNYTPWLVSLYYFAYIIWFVFLLIVAFAVYILWRGDMNSSVRVKFGHVLAGAILMFFAISLVSPSVADEHPVFKTPLSGRPLQRPSIMVDITDDSESMPYFTTAELYLEVSSSRSPNRTRLLFPLNVHDFSGCRQRFIQLPFEVAEGDMLLFNLLDDDNLSPQEEKLIHDACQVSGYCLWIGAKYYEPCLPSELQIQLLSAVTILGEAIVAHAHSNPYQHMGKGEYIASADRITMPASANKISIVEDNHQRATVRIYFADGRSNSP